MKDFSFVSGNCNFDLKVENYKDMRLECLENHIFKDTRSYFLHFPKGIDTSNFSGHTAQIRNEDDKIIFDFCHGEDPFQIWKLQDCIMKDNMILCRIETNPQMIELNLTLESESK